MNTKNFCGNYLAFWNESHYLELGKFFFTGIRFKQFSKKNEIGLRSQISWLNVSIMTCILGRPNRGFPMS